MMEKQNAPRPASEGSKQVVKTGRTVSGTYSATGRGKEGTVTQTSERIIKATSVKRRTAMKVLADR